MKYTLSLREDQLEFLKQALSDQGNNEHAGYLFCSRSVTPSEMRFIVQKLEMVLPEDIESRSQRHVAIRSQSYVKALQKADREGLSFFLVHSHPFGPPDFSKQDNREEMALFSTAYIRAPQGPHGSIILTGTDQPEITGRVWLDSKKKLPIKRIRVVGHRLRIFDKKLSSHSNILPPWSDRQVRAFGPEAQATLAKLHVGVVGAGGTGSCVCEQLIRLGVGEITVVDEQDLADTNVTRLYGSRQRDVGTSKSALMKSLAKSIGLGTKVHAVTGSVCDQRTAEQLRECDVLFGCTDDSFGRMCLNRIALWYYIPVIDLAVAIDSESGTIKSVTGRVTKLFPGSSCLRCRGRISQEDISADMLRRTNLDEYEQRAKEGYAPELRTPDPSIIMFTTGIASRAMIEFIQMITGFMGDGRSTTEVCELYHETYIGRNSRQGNEGCVCASPQKWGKGDQSRFLGLIW